MKFLSLTTESPNFRIEGENLVWTISNQIFENNITEIAVASCLFHFSDIHGRQNPMILTCSLVDENYCNYNGIIVAGVSEFKFFSFYSKILEFWRLDCSRPRKVVFTLRRVAADKIKFANITLALQ